MRELIDAEALKAQAVTARTYALRLRDYGGGIDTPSGKADVSADYTHGQAYISLDDALLNWGKNGQSYLKKIRGAVESTAGEVIVYQDKVIDAVFHAASSGHTENAKDVWGSELPYLVSVESAGDENDDYLSTVVVQASDFKSIILKAQPKADLSGSPDSWCKSMKKTTLVQLYESLLNDTCEILIDEEVRIKAEKALNRMLELS
jgi:stage II sporulation protein D